MKPFVAGLTTVNIDVSSSNQRVALGPLRGGPFQVRIANDGTATVWIAFGDVTVTAALASGLPVASGAIEVLTCPDVGGAPYMAAIAAGSTGKIYANVGTGN